MVFVRQQNTWFASGKFVGSYIDKKTNKVLNNTAIIYPYKYTNVFLWTTNNDVKKQILSLKKDDQVLAWGEVRFRKTTSKPLFIMHAIMKAPVPNISLKEENGLDIEYAKYLEQMNDINLNDFANKDT